MILGSRVINMIRKNLLYYRKRVFKKSLDEMSTDVNISRDTLYRLENNGDNDKPLYPNLKTLITLSDYFNLDLSDFVSKDMEMEELDRINTIEKLERMGDFY
jgi:DNA-binding XRE family transcriptional regulator